MSSYTYECPPSRPLSSQANFKVSLEDFVDITSVDHTDSLVSHAGKSYLALTKHSLLFLFALSRSYKSVQSASNLHPKSISLDDPTNRLVNCQGRFPNDEKCINMMFAPDTPFVRSILTNFTLLHEMRSGERWDIVDQPQTFYQRFDSPQKRLGILPVPSSDFIYDYVLQKQNTTMLGIVFDISENADGLNARYQVWFNATIFQGKDPSGNDFFSPQLLYFERTMEEAILRTADPSRPASFTIDLKPFPKVGPTVVPDRLSVSLGPAFFFIISCIPTLLMALNSLVSEKEKKLKLVMTLMGLRLESWMIAWFLTYAIISALNSLVLVGIGRLMKFEFFVYCNFGILYFTFWLHALSELALAFLFAIFIRRSSSAVLLSTYAFIFGLLFMCVIFSNAHFGFLWYNSQYLPIIIGKLLVIVPFFNFGVLLTSITSMTIKKVTLLSGDVIMPLGFHWSDLNKDLSTSVLPFPSYKPPKPIWAWYWMLIDTALFMVVAWYFDSVFRDQFGKRQPLLFFLKPTYWGFGNRKSKKLALHSRIEDMERDYDKLTAKTWNDLKKQNLKKKNNSESDLVDLNCPNRDESVMKARRLALDADTPAGLRVMHLRKLFNGKVAVNDSCFTVNKNEILVILGGNGSGKTTTCQMLCGIIPATFGDALLDESFSLMHDLRTTNTPSVGWCPQHDILFGELTPLEHISLYGKICGISSTAANAIAKDRLTRVQLWHRRNDQVSKFSGGMRRRLSMVLSTVGDPNLLILDEVSTGVDPISRKSMWQFLEYFKTKCIIILVTHSMEEAELLGDKIIVLQKSNIVAAGTPLSLKSKSSGDYRLYLTTKVVPVSSVKPPGSSTELESVTADEAIWRVTNLADLSAVIQWADKSEKAGLILAWGIGMLSLEDVLLEGRMF